MSNSNVSLEYFHEKGEARLTAEMRQLTLASLAILAFALIGQTRASEDFEDSPLTNRPETGMQQHFQEAFLIGVALDGDPLTSYSTAELNLVRKEFGAVTAANCMKMPQTQPAEGVFNFSMADRLVDFAVSNHIKVCGHCLLWAKDERTPEWMFREGDKAIERERLLQRLHDHINKVAGQYRGNVISWDVVNEALDDGTNYIRASKWMSILGEDFIVKAFQFAREADPNAVLVYNDYNIELPRKREKLIRLLRMLQDQHAPIQAVGIQGHYEINSVPYADIEETVSAVQGLGLKVMFTELDLDVIPRAKWWAEGGKYHDELAQVNPYTNGCPAGVLQAQAEQYRKLFAIFSRHRDVIARVSFWDLHDGRSWLNHFPWERVNHPLLFDRNTRPKPAYEAIMNEP
jgi:endo-1,4-beta-xylanase